MALISGKILADRIRKTVKRKASSFPTKPGLGVILIGDDPASHVYVGLKEKAAHKAGIYFEKLLFQANEEQSKIVEAINGLNQRNDIHGILVQFPLPKGFSKDAIINSIALEKDVDGFRPDSIEALRAGKPLIIPGLAAGIVQLIDGTGEELDEKRAVVLANSTVFYEPLEYLLRHKGVSTAMLSPEEKVLKHKLKKADIIVAAVGAPRLITGDMIKEDAIVIDVGYNRVNGKPVGDVDFDSVQGKASWITPVPGGVGPMTVAMLLYNVVRAYEIQND